MSNAPNADVVVRASTGDDVPCAKDAVALIEAAAKEFDMATREHDFLAGKIAAGQAALALHPGAGGDELVGFGYWSEWEGGRFLSHSGLVVAPEARGLGLGRRLKMVLFETSRAAFPEAAMMSLTTSPAVQAMNHSLGFRDCPLEQLTDDPAFWAACRDCRNYADAQAAGRLCCNDGMILLPGNGPSTDVASASMTT